MHVCRMTGDHIRAYLHSRMINRLLRNIRFLLALGIRVRTDKNLQTNSYILSSRYCKLNRHQIEMLPQFSPCGFWAVGIWMLVKTACAAVWSPADQDRFICIYPAYLNNKKTIAEGRRIPISKAVENPTATEIQDVCSAVGLNVFLEKNKMYSREWNRDVQYRGRVRVQLKQEDGSLCLVQFPSR